MKASEIIYTNLNDLFNGCIYPLVRPESESVNPFMVYRILNTNPENFIQGYSGDELAYIQLDIYAEDYDSCEDLTNTVIETLNTVIKPFHYENRQYLYEDETKLFRQIMTCHLWQKQ